MVWGSPAPRCGLPQTHRQPQFVLCATGGSTALSPRGCPRQTGGWSCMTGGGSGARGVVQGPWSPPHPISFSQLVWRKGSFQAEVGDPGRVMRFTLGTGDSVRITDQPWRGCGSEEGPA